MGLLRSIGASVMAQLAALRTPQSQAPAPREGAQGPAVSEAAPNTPPSTEHATAAGLAAENGELRRQLAEQAIEILALKQHLMTQRLKWHPFLALFDGADTNASTAQRVTTTIPTQALFLMNNPFVHEQAAGFDERIAAACGVDEGRVAWAFELALGRGPTFFARTLLARNEFLFVD